MIPISLNVSKQSTRKFVSIPGAKKKGSEVNFEKSARKVGNMELSEDRIFYFSFEQCARAPTQSPLSGRLHQILIYNKRLLKKKKIYIHKVKERDLSSPLGFRSRHDRLRRFISRELHSCQTLKAFIIKKI